MDMGRIQTNSFDYLSRNLQKHTWRGEKVEIYT